MNQVNYFFPFWIILLLNHANKIPWFPPIWSIPSQIHLWFKNPCILSCLFFDVHITTTQTPSSWIQTPRNICHLFYNVHIPTTQKNRFPSIINNIISIILYRCNSALRQISSPTTINIIPQENTYLTHNDDLGKTWQIHHVHVGPIW